MVFIHHVLLLLLHVLFSHTGTGVIAQRSWIIAEGDDVFLPERCPDSSEDGASSLTAKVVNGASHLTAKVVNGASNLTATELTNINGASNLTATELTNINGASNLTAAELTNINGASNLTAAELTNINGASNLTAAELTNINGASNLTATELTNINGASNLTATELTNINGASNLSAEVFNGTSSLSAEVFNGTSSLSLTEVINGDTGSGLTDAEVIKRNAHITSSPEILVTGPECPSHLPKKAITAEDAGLYCCRDGTNNRIHVSVLSRGSIRRYNVTSTFSFSCVLVTAKGQGASCVDPTVRLMWVDVEDNEIQNRVIRRGSCNTRVIVQNEDSRVFLCQAYRGTEVKATLSFPMRPPGPGKGRRGILGPDPNDDDNNSGSEVDPQSQGGNGGVAVVMVGVVSCVALTALLTLFVVNRRRSSKPLPANLDNINCDICSDDVVYADLDLPVSSGVLIMPKQEVSEYASVRTHMYEQ